MSRLAIPVLLGILVFGCTSNYNSGNDPKKTLSDYISQSFSIKTVDDRKNLLNLMTGNVKARLSSWSDEQFQEAFIDSKREFLKLSLREVKTVSPSEVQITYELIYIDKGINRDGRSHEAKITNRKLCQLVMEQGKWYISDVRNIKELVEYKNELSLP